jgi:hypothetical protein
LCTLYHIWTQGGNKGIATSLDINLFLHRLLGVFGTNSKLGLRATAAHRNTGEGCPKCFCVMRTFFQKEHFIMHGLVGTFLSSKRDKLPIF